ncbi:MAG: hypothetical protein IT422_07160 [Pirellulaceae bacterium]|nr:hypothetical protein [Pirellulaceae bacterium]
MKPPYVSGGSGNSPTWQAGPFAGYSLSPEDRRWIDGLIRTGQLKAYEQALLDAFAKQAANGYDPALVFINIPPDLPLEFIFPPGSQLLERAKLSKAKWDRLIESQQRERARIAAETARLRESNIVYRRESDGSITRLVYYQGRLYRDDFFGKIEDWKFVIARDRDPRELSLAELREIDRSEQAQAKLRTEKLRDLKADLERLSERLANSKNKGLAEERLKEIGEKQAELAQLLQEDLLRQQGKLPPQQGLSDARYLELLQERRRRLEQSKAAGGKSKQFLDRINAELAALAVSITEISASEQLRRLEEEYPRKPNQSDASYLADLASQREKLEKSIASGGKAKQLLDRLKADLEALDSRIAELTTSESLRKATQKFPKAPNESKAAYVEKLERERTRVFQRIANGNRDDDAKLRNDYVDLIRLLNLELGHEKHLVSDIEGIGKQRPDDKFSFPSFEDLVRNELQRSRSDEAIEEFGQSLYDNPIPDYEIFDETRRLAEVYFEQTLQSELLLRNALGFTKDEQISSDARQAIAAAAIEFDKSLQALFIAFNVHLFNAVIDPDKSYSEVQSENPALSAPFYNGRSINQIVDEYWVEGIFDIQGFRDAYSEGGQLQAEEHFILRAAMAVAGGFVLDKIAGRFGPSKSAPELPEHYRNTFQDGVYGSRNATGNEVFYKYHGVDNQTGKSYTFVTKEKYASEAALRNELGILTEWGIEIDRVTTFRPPKGTWIREGVAARQVGNFGEIRRGGGWQGVIDTKDLPNTSIINTEKLPKAFFDNDE